MFLGRFSDTRIGQSDERSTPEVDKRYQEKQAMADWKSVGKLEERANFSRHGRKPLRPIEVHNRLL